MTGVTPIAVADKRGGAEERNRLVSIASGAPDAVDTVDVESAPLYVVGDVHGHLDELQAALRDQGLIDEDGHWSGGAARLWFLGDFTDRGPDGIGVRNALFRAYTSSHFHLACLPHLPTMPM
jgi:hypothetical protein